MKTSTLKAETLNHLTIVAEQINKTGAFEHFTKMVNANVNPYSLQETLIAKYDVNPNSLDYLYKGSDEQCVESSLLIAIRYDELRTLKDKAKSFLNYAEISRTFANDRSSITRDRVSDIHKEKIETLVNLVADWILTLPVK